MAASTLKYDPEFEAATTELRATMARTPKAPAGDVEARRKRVAGMFAIANERIPRSTDVEIVHHEFEARDGVKIGLYHFSRQPHANNPTSALIHAHGGGFIAGNARMLDNNLARTVSKTGISIFAVEYRLAPEVADETLVQDCYAALLWVHEHASELNIDKARIGIHGESAGGGIAAGLALMARDEKLSPPLAKQILIYPMIDDTNTNPVPLMADKLVWSVDDNTTGWRAMLGDKIGTSAVSPYCAPFRATSLAGLPSTYIDVGGLDLFVSENAMYATRLISAGNEVEFHLFPGVPHSWQNLAPDIAITKVALEARMRAMLSF